MNKKINIILASVLCSFNLMAQVDTLTIHKDKVVIDYGAILLMMQERLPVRFYGYQR